MFFSLCEKLWKDSQRIVWRFDITEKQVLRYTPSIGVCVNKWCRRSIRLTFDWVFTGTNPHVRFVRRQLYRSTTSAQTSSSTISAGNVECVTRWLRTWIERTITSRQTIYGYRWTSRWTTHQGWEKPVFLKKTKTTQLFLSVCLEKNVDFFKRNNAKNRPEKGQTNCWKAWKKPNLVAALPFLCHKKHKLQEIKKMYSILKLNLAWHCTGAVIFPDISWFVKLQTLGKMVPQFAYWSIGNFLHENLSHSLLDFRSES